MVSLSREYSSQSLTGEALHTLLTWIALREIPKNRKEKKLQESGIHVAPVNRKEYDSD